MIRATQKMYVTPVNILYVYFFSQTQSSPLQNQSIVITYILIYHPQKLYFLVV